MELEAVPRASPAGMSPKSNVLTGQATKILFAGAHTKVAAPVNLSQDHEDWQKTGQQASDWSYCSNRVDHASAMCLSWNS